MRAAKNYLTMIFNFSAVNIWLILNFGIWFLLLSEPKRKRTIIILTGGWKLITFAIDGGPFHHVDITLRTPQAAVIIRYDIPHPVGQFWYMVELVKRMFPQTSCLVRSTSMQRVATVHQAAVFAIAALIPWWSHPVAVETLKKKQFHFLFIEVTVLIYN